MPHQSTSTSLRPMPAVPPSEEWQVDATTDGKDQRMWYILPPESESRLIVFRSLYSCAAPNHDANERSRTGRCLVSDARSCSMQNSKMTCRSKQAEQAWTSVPRRGRKQDSGRLNDGRHENRGFPHARSSLSAHDATASSCSSISLMKRPLYNSLRPVRAIAIGDSSSFAQLLVGSGPARIVRESWANEQPSSVQLLRPRQFFGEPVQLC
ncbi:hypothetical protein FIBSPDRAFT_488360 [Athelia psychrophila]|uniref:Uncharacterized protein n=1 Tax=Athelia psychrophila TaxID=1759441 RepID=A0A166KRL5_9AGAM|nr:hypothetical protein FIBSPDRAFT_488360 [Fibularhizoctonia sp. CBS 109695]